MGQVARFAFILLCSAALIMWGLARRSTTAWCALAVLVAVDLGIFAQRFTPEGRTEYLDVDLAVVRTMQADAKPMRMCSIGPGDPDFLNRMPANVPMLFGLQDIQGSESLLYGRYQRLLDRISSERFGPVQPDPGLPAVDLLGVKYLLTPLRIDDSGWRLQQSYETRLYANDEALPRAFIAERVRVHDAEPELLQAVTSANFDPRVVHLMRSELPEQAQRASALPSAALEVAEYAANQVTLRGDFRAGQLVVLTDVLYPGWRAFADGQEQQIIPADYVLRAAVLTRRATTLSFVYLPASYQLGAFTSLVALAALVALASAAAIGRLRRE